MPDKQDSLLDFPSPLLTGVAQRAVSRTWRDTGFRGVLAHALAAVHLFRLLAKQGLVVILDPRTLRREPTRQVGHEQQTTENDVIWSTPSARPAGEGPGRVFLMVEVQSTVERDMALRMNNYVTVLSMQLRAEYGGELPDVVPIVLYTGDRPWNASLEVHALYANEHPECPPRLRYLLVDLCRLEVAEGSENLIELLALVVRSASEEELLGGARRLQHLLAALGNEPMEKSFFELVLAQCEKKWPDENWEDCSSMAELVDAVEERVKTWPEKWKERYIAEGRAEGRSEGRAEGRAEGRSEGRSEGRAEGREEISHAVFSSLEEAVRARFGESVADSFRHKVELARRAAVARDLDVIDAICRCVMLSENADQLLAGVQSVRLESV